MHIVKFIAHFTYWIYCSQSHLEIVGQIIFNTIGLIIFTFPILINNLYGVNE